MPRRLGKMAARRGAVRLRLASYINSAALPSVPAVFGHETLIADWGMLANDRYGDCVWAGAAHETMMLGREANAALAFDDRSVLSDYAAVTGFNASDPATDQGTDMQIAADYRRKTGIVDAHGVRHKIAAYLALEPGNVAHLYQAAYLFGAAGIGLQLPAAALQQSESGQTWDVVDSSPIAGGHYVPLVGRRADGLHVITWGTIQVITEKFLKKYCDEALAYVSQECFVHQRSPEGFSYADLISDLEALS